MSASISPCKSIFSGLAAGVKTPYLFLKAPSEDRLASLIAWSYLHPNLEQMVVSSPKQIGDLSGFFRVQMQWVPQRGEDAPKKKVVVFCAELREAMSRQWD